MKLNIKSYRRKYRLLTVATFIGLFGISTFADGAEVLHLDKIANSKEWLNLLYYKKKGDSYQSLVIRDDFFIAGKDGSQNPELELKKTIALFKGQRNTEDAHPQCLFPARYLFLKKHFSLAQKVSCPKLNEWLESYAPTGLSLVYASQYVSNPASVFGHSYFLLPSKNQTRGFWHTYNFAATIPAETSGPAYVYGGITGWFTADYSVMPYYQRIFQYGSVENRDLWVYPIQLTKEELEFAIAHLWELIHTSRFQYYFFDDNCAGILLKTLAAILPDVDHRVQLPYTHPINVIKALKKSNRLGLVEFQPSEAKKLKQQLSRLSKEQKNNFIENITQPTQKLKLDETPADLKVLDTLIQYIFYQRQKNMGEVPPQYKELEKQTYILRSQFSQKPDLSVDKKGLLLAPDLSAEPSTYELGTSTVNDDLTIDFAYRFNMHSLVDPSPGFLPNSAIESLYFQFSYADEKFWIKEFLLAHMATFQDWTFFDQIASWRIQAAYRENLLTDNNDDTCAEADIAYGYSAAVGASTIYAAINSRLHFTDTEGRSDLELGPEVGWIFNKNPRYKFVGSAAYLKEIFQGSTDFVLLHLKFEAQYFLNNKSSLIVHGLMQKEEFSDLDGYRSGLFYRYFF